MICKIYYKDSWYDADAKIFSITNRGIKYGDGFFESMTAFNKKICFLEDHFERIKKTASVLEFDVKKAGFTKDLLNRNLDHFIKSNQLNACAVRVQFIRSFGSKYTPASMDCDFIIEFSGKTSTKFSAELKLEKSGLYKEHLLQKNSTLSPLKTSNSLLYVLAKSYCTKNELNDVILFNNNLEIAEFSSSNIYLDMGDKILTPPLSSGCLDGIIRRQLLKPETKKHFHIQEFDLYESDLENAVAIYGSNTSMGIFFIEQIGQQTYTSGQSVALTEFINSKIS